MKKEFGLFFWIHLTLLILAYLSPLFVDWKIIVSGVVLLQIQYWLINGCYLTHLEMGKDRNQVFVWYYLQKLYPTLNPKTTKFTVRVIVPILLVIFALILQTKLGFTPLLHF